MRRRAEGLGAGGGRRSFQPRAPGVCVASRAGFVGWRGSVIKWCIMGPPQGLRSYGPCR